jgi:hypothetical protein
MALPVLATYFNQTLVHMYLPKHVTINPGALGAPKNNSQGESAFDCMKSGSDALHKYLQSIDLYLSSLSSTCVQESSMLG